MLLEFIATISAGAGAAGIVLLIGRLTSGALPKWLLPAAAGAAMLAFSIWTDYSWFDRAQQGLGAEKVVATTIDKRQIWRPWTYVAPVTTRFIALDRTRADQDDATVFADMYLVSRREDSVIVPAAFDCLLGRRADLIGAEGGTPEARLESARWHDLGEDDPVLRTACDRLR
ncbi:hypothetical protein [Celeribacter indicus]|uniref:Uncharacterized protein n=1 Tax=Celeribacter indicus TaxID=1208324 RepID=A0A0B5E6I9_9RHOB|nr:hypothetical protein [Celeribacter indicus]AJE48616.1 hypothetical protein P73_3901 [Celeribacter indicus]SDX50852.1 hypothetical protein SAMN05443573_1355 [Celeribacter indicus]